MPRESLDNDRSGHSAGADLKARLAVDVWMIPIESRLLVLRNVHDVTSPLTGSQEHGQHVVSRPLRRDAQPVEMQVHVLGVAVRVGRRNLREIVLEVDDERLAGLDVDRRSDFLHAVVDELRLTGYGALLSDERDCSDAVDGAYDRRLGKYRAFRGSARMLGAGELRQRVDRTGGAAGTAREPCRDDS